MFFKRNMYESLLSTLIQLKSKYVLQIYITATNYKWLDKKRLPQSLKMLVGLSYFSPPTMRLQKKDGLINHHSIGKAYLYWNQYFGDF